ncbi:hypothetical protein DSO57_1039445 [Entomophthora muscae]|uniref:Uncharacterized protein n=1 Tax=Entomophthora muscae TaxID=34485 RepID=A0ACC2RD43_9FUNG|nr:hypothetical protein DSO57_1039445 [Entomophthora muscae]
MEHATMLPPCGLVASPYIAIECLEFLGHEVTQTGICPMKKKVEAIDKMFPPTKLHKV